MRAVAERAAVSLTCSACGLAWEVAPKADGTMPQGARCPAALGGCGKFARVPRATSPRPAPRLSVAVPAAVPAWDPPGESRKPYETAEVCPACAAPLWATPRGTRQVCKGCVRLVPPRGVSAPYERSGGGQAVRQVRSQRERDAERRDVAERKAVLAGQLRRLLEAGNLDDGSAGRVESYLDDVRAAETMSRLDELVEEFGGERLRKRGWLGGRVAAEIEPAGDDGDQDGEDDWDGDSDGRDGAERAAAPVTAARPRRMTWAEALDFCGWRLTPAGDDCRVAEGGQLCGAETRHQITARHVRYAGVCSPHYYALGGVITDAAASAAALATPASIAAQQGDALDLALLARGIPRGQLPHYRGTLAAITGGRQ